MRTFSAAASWSIRTRSAHRDFTSSMWRRSSSRDCSAIRRRSSDWRCIIATRSAENWLSFCTFCSDMAAFFSASSLARSAARAWLASWRRRCSSQYFAISSRLALAASTLAESLRFASSQRARSSEILALHIAWSSTNAALARRTRSSAWTSSCSARRSAASMRLRVFASQARLRSAASLASAFGITSSWPRWFCAICSFASKCPRCASRSASMVSFWPAAIFRACTTQTRSCASTFWHSRWRSARSCCASETFETASSCASRISLAPCACARLAKVLARSISDRAPRSASSELCSLTAKILFA
mmetsp:Transcript_36694/g.105825  ORF Transcript_36694/g.105825 Transcript_36694/m.105825 type:complete len:304 (-) Transcript_36694:329-1240(-)